MLNRVRHVLCGLLCILLVAGPTAPAFADFWEDAGRVAAGVATGGWSEVIIDLITAVTTFKDSVDKATNDATRGALADVRYAVQANQALVTAAEQRANKAMDSGRQAANSYLSVRAHPEQKRAPEGMAGTPGTRRESKVGPATSQVGRPAGATNPPPTPPPGDPTVIRDAEARLVAEGQDFRKLAGDLHEKLNAVNTGAEAQVTGIKGDITSQILVPLGVILADLASFVVPAGGMVGIQEVSAKIADQLDKLHVVWSGWSAAIYPDLDTKVTTPAYDQIAAANTGRATTAADQIEKLANLIVEATTPDTGWWHGSGPAMDQLRKELGLPKLADRPVGLRVADAPPGGAAGTGRAGTAKPSARTARLQALSVQLTEAQRLLGRLQQLRPQVDASLVRSADGYLEEQFRGKSPQEVQATQAALLATARQRFGGQPQLLRVVEQMIAQRAAGRPLGLAVSPASGR